MPTSTAGRCSFRLLFVVGGIPGLWLVERIGRRQAAPMDIRHDCPGTGSPSVHPRYRPKTLFTSPGNFCPGLGCFQLPRSCIPQRVFPPRSGPPPSASAPRSAGWARRQAPTSCRLRWQLRCFRRPVDWCRDILGGAHRHLGILAPETRGRSLIDASTATPRPDRSASAATSDDATTTTTVPLPTTPGPATPEKRHQAQRQDHGPQTTVTKETLV